MLVILITNKWPLTGTINRYDFGMAYIVDANIAHKTEENFSQTY